MTKEQRAREALLSAFDNARLPMGAAFEVALSAMLAFAAEERERCARVADNWKSSLRPGSQDRLNGHIEAARNIATAIRNLEEGQ